MKKESWSKMIKKSFFVGGILGIIYYQMKKIQKEKKLKEIYQSYYQLTVRWLQNKCENKEIADYFRENNINNIAIYGCGTLGERLYNDLKNKNIDVKYFIDQKAREIYYTIDNIKTISLEEVRKVENVDAIVVTPIFYYKEIRENLDELYKNSNIISLEDIVYELF